jgi:hypothetical protein
MTETASLWLGGSGAQVNFAILNFQITGVPDGTFDLFGIRSDFLTPGTERALLRRDVVVSGDGSLGTVDFAGAESFTPSSATITLSGLLGGESVSQSTFYHTGATCDAAPIVPFATGGASFATLGIPGAQQRATDFHRVSLLVGTAGSMRYTDESFHTMADRTITLGAALPTPTIASLWGAYKRLQATFTLPADYQVATTFAYQDAQGERTVSIGASLDYLGGTSAVLGLADFTGVGGWNNTWAPDPSSTGDWNVAAVGGSGGSSSKGGALTRRAARALFAHGAATAGDRRSGPARLAGRAGRRMGEHRDAALRRPHRRAAAVRRGGGAAAGGCGRAGPFAGAGRR